MQVLGASGGGVAVDVDGGEALEVLPVLEPRHRASRPAHRGDQCAVVDVRSCTARAVVEDSVGGEDDIPLLLDLVIPVFVKVLAEGVLDDHILNRETVEDVLKGGGVCRVRDACHIVRPLSRVPG